MQITMNNLEIDKLRHEVYTLWYHENDGAKKETLQKVLNLIDFTNEAIKKLQSVANLFSSML
jgi:hypothetical protein